MKQFLLLLLPILPFPALAQQQPDPDAPLIRVNVNLVQVDAVVTGKDGRILTGLQPNEFEILQDGKPRPITRFAFIPNTTAPRPAATANGIPLPPPTVNPKDIRRSIVLVVDDLALTFESIAAVRQAIQSFTATLHPGDLVALLRTSSGSGSFQSFTTDHNRIRLLASGLRWYPRSRTGLSYTRPVGTNAANMSAGTRPSLREYDSDAAEAAILNQTAGLGTTSALQWIINGLGPVPGRKSIILFSEGFRMQNDLSHVDSINATLADPVLRLTAQATRAGVVIYTVDPRGLLTSNIVAADDVRNSEQALSVTGRRAAEQRQTQLPLRLLANDTGGMFLFSNSVENSLQRVLDDQAGFYLLGYDPDNETFDRKYHRISVRVKRPGARVRTRNGFVGIDDGSARPTTRQPILEALHAPFHASGIPVKLTGLFALDPQNNPILHCLLHIGIQNTKLTPGPDGKLHSKMDILVASFDPNGVSPHNTIETIDFAIDPAKLEETRARGMSAAIFYPVRKPGPYQLRAAIREQATGALGSASQFVVAPDLRKNRMALSGLLAAPARPPAEGLRLATRRFAPGEELAYSVQILNPKKEADLSAQVRLVADGRLLFESPAKALSNPEAASGVIRLSKDIAPGEYALQIVVTDSSGKKPLVLSEWTDIHVQAQ